MKKTLFYCMLATLTYVSSAFAVTPDGSPGANFIASIVNTSRTVWIPALLATGFLVLVYMILFSRGGGFIQAIGKFALAIFCVAGLVAYFLGFADGAVSLTMTLPLH